MAKWVMVCEVGPRDGLQMSRSRMATAAKVRWIEALAAAGLPEIEVGSFVPPRLIPQMADIAEVVQATLLPCVIVAPAPNLHSAQAAAAAGGRRVSTPCSVSEGHSRTYANRGTMDRVAEVRRIVAWSR